MSTPTAVRGSLLDRAVDQGIITSLQRDEILALDGDGGPGAEIATEAPPGLNAVTIAYFVGGAAILFGFGWFLVDRWRVLGAAGVLVVALVYAALFLGVAHWLRREGYPRARGIAVLAAVAMTPIVAWALLELTGFWTPALGGEPPVPAVHDTSWEAIRWIPLELATILSALIALRRVDFGLLTLPIPVALWAIGAQVAVIAYEPATGGWMQPWVSFLTSAVLLAIGYAVDRRTSSAHQDFAWTFYLLALASLTLGWLEAWPQLRTGRHALPVVSLLLVIAALQLRRRVFLLFAQLGVVAWIAWLGLSVFRQALGFPIALATVGLVVILGTVWGQRRFPQLAARSRRQPGERPELPGGWLGPAGAMLVSAALLLTAPTRVEARRQDREIREHVQRMRAANVRRLAERTGAQSGKPGSAVRPETPPRRAPY